MSVCLIIWTRPCDINKGAKLAKFKRSCYVKKFSEKIYISYFPADIICSEEQQSSRKLCVQFIEQVVSKDKYVQISWQIWAPKGIYFVQYPLNTFRNPRSIEISLWYFPVLAGEYLVIWRVIWWIAIGNITFKVKSNTFSR